MPTRPIQLSAADISDMSIRVLSLALVQVHAAVILRGPDVTEDSYIRGGSSHSESNKKNDENTAGAPRLSASPAEACPNLDGAHPDARQVRRPLHRHVGRPSLRSIRTSSLVAQVWPVKDRHKRWSHVKASYPIAAAVRSSDWPAGKSSAASSSVVVAILDEATAKWPQTCRLVTVARTP